jgi:hypothetical protein
VLEPAGTAWPKVRYEVAMVILLQKGGTERIVNNRVFVPLKSYCDTLAK